MQSKVHRIVMCSVYTSTICNVIGYRLQKTNCLELLLKNKSNYIISKIFISIPSVYLFVVAV